MKKSALSMAIVAIALSTGFVSAVHARPAVQSRGAHQEQLQAPRAGDELQAPRGADDLQAPRSGR